MKFFHLSDLHIGLKLINRDLLEDQRYILNQVIQLALQEQPDALVVAGDIYDKSIPSAEAVAVFDDFIAKLTREMPKLTIMMISGNHDSAPRLNCFRSVLAHQHVHMVGMPPQTESEFIEKVTLEDAYGPVNFYLLPFVKPSMAKQIVGVDEKGNNRSYEETVRLLLARESIDQTKRNVLVSHQFYLPAGVSAGEVERTDSEIRTVGNIDEVSAAVLEPFDYAALGHIHKPMKVGNENLRYCGTPLACSVSEAGQQKGIISVEMGEKGQIHTEVLPLHPLRQVCVYKGTEAEVLNHPSEDYISILLTGQTDLDTQDRIRAAFPNLLEIRRERNVSEDRAEWSVLHTQLDPFDLCCSFLQTQEDDEEERAILRDVINTILGSEGV